MLVACGSSSNTETGDDGGEGVSDASSTSDSSSSVDSATLDAPTSDSGSLSDAPAADALAASSGGAPGQAIITVDGFQNSSTLPPKSSIASIRVNPDMFSAEYDLSRSLVLKASASQTRFHSTAVGANYTEDKFMIGLKVQR